MKLVFSILFALTILYSYAQTPVEQHGRLQVSGKYVGNQNNQKISLAGHSLFWSNYSAGSKFYNAETVNHIAQNWNSSMVRAALSVEIKEEGKPDDEGYIHDIQNGNYEQKQLVENIINAAIDNGIYVIIDWHSHKAEDYQQQAIDFFTEMAEKYGTYDNVIYEIYNEPINTTWSSIKSYSEAVIQAIRSKDPDNLIIVGTSFYSQKVVEASLNPINDVNVAYTLHFYAGSHESLREKAQTAFNNGLPIFVTEWGTVNANGGGGVSYYQTDLWMDFLKDNYISHVNWSLSDVHEGASVINPDAGIYGLQSDKLTPSGWKVKDIISNWNVPPVNIDGDPPVGGGLKYEAENAILFGVNISSNGQYVTGMTDDGDKIVFNNVSVPSSGTYPLTIRYACTSDKQNYVSINGGSNENISFPESTAFTNKTFDVNLNEGNNTITIEKHWGWFDVDYMEIGGTGNEQPEPPQQNETLKFEAENGTFTGVNTANEANASNGQYVAGFDNDGDKVVVNANVERGGMYQLKIGYRSTSGDKKNDIYLNNTFLGNILFSQSNNFTEIVVDDLYFEAGQNTLEFVKSWGWMDVDYFELIAAEDQSGSINNNICSRTLQISDNTTAEYYVANIINSDAIVVENNSAEFIGIQEINLDNDFTVKTGARFLAAIEDCAN